MTTPQMTKLSNGGRAWQVNGQLHREDGPAVEYADGYRAWYFNGQRHRTDGPAIILSNGTCAWYINGQRVGEGTVRLLEFLLHK